MTNKKINIAIAEHCGWRIAERVSPEVKEDATACWIRPNGNEWQEENLPDYCNDLNAMHEAEKALNENKKNTFAFMLAQVLDTSPKVDLSDQFLNIHATARQRAEAFLKTIGKWEE
jgi:hypothetical protein